MTRYAVFLRAVNVGGRNKVPMARLRELATEAGFTDVATYVQSGNLVVEAGSNKAAAVERAIARAIKTDLGLDITVMARTRRELAEVMAANPFADIADDPAKMIVSFLESQPAAAKLKPLDRDEFLPERFEFGKRCIYFWHPDGLGRSKMAIAPWHRRIGVRGTGRNLRTIAKLLDLLDDNG
jgi:uncharacterized protein (DUF1697 family)